MVLQVYFMPYLIVNMWLVMITLLQHTHPSLPHFNDAEWEWLRGALSTVDRSYGLLDVVFHHIADTHVCHHLFSTMPHYHAQVNMSAAADNCLVLEAHAWPCMSMQVSGGHWYWPPCI